MTEAATRGRVGLVCLILGGATGTAWLLASEAFQHGGGPDRVPVVLVGGSAADAAPAAPPSDAGPPEGAPPRVEVARIGARGMLVTAGSAPPGAEVLLLEGGREIGRARADGRGEWVILPPDPLPPGPRELALLARSPGAAPLWARDTLLLLVPDRRREAATAAASPRGAAEPRGAAPRDAAGSPGGAPPDTA
ncbi:hypothetical protein, partial [Paracraurococcus ruber]|nr:hypothetical protein [Paracraurococcus ruber]